MSEEELHTSRHRIIRKRGFTFSDSGLSRSTVSEGAEIVDDDKDLNDSVRTISKISAPALKEENPPTIDFLMKRGTAKSRLHKFKDTEYEVELRLNILHRLLLKGYTKDEICDELGISPRQYDRNRAELTQRLRDIAKSLDIDGIVGNSKEFYEEAQGMALQIATSTGTPVSMKLAAIRTALASHNDMHRFFQAAGIYDVLRFRKGTGDGTLSDIQRLMTITQDLLSEAKSNRKENVLGDFSGGDKESLDI